MQIKLKHFYYNETENAFIFVKKVETRRDGVDIVWAAQVNSNEEFGSDHTYTYMQTDF